MTITPDDARFLEEQLEDLRADGKCDCLSCEPKKRLLRIVEGLREALKRERAYVNQDIRGGYALADMKQAQLDTLKSKLAEKEKENEKLREVCAEAYQLAGTYDAPVKALDNLSAACAGHPIPHETFLPMENQWESKLADAEARIKEMEKVLNGASGIIKLLLNYVPVTLHEGPDMVLRDIEAIRKEVE